MCNMVCDGQIDIATAQAAFVTDWIAAYHTYYEARKKRPAGFTPSIAPRRVHAAPLPSERRPSNRPASPRPTACSPRVLEPQLLLSACSCTPHRGRPEVLLLFDGRASYLDTSFRIGSTRYMAYHITTSDRRVAFARVAFHMHRKLTLSTQPVGHHLGLGWIATS